MTTCFKPFRLINGLELKALETRFATPIALWNKEQALFPLACHLSTKPDTPSQGIGTLFMDDKGRALAFMPEQDLFAIQYALFGELSTSFNSITKNLLTSLVCDLSAALVEPRENAVIVMEDWFYKGAPLLGMTLCVADHALKLYFHPEWVITTLPSMATGCQPKVPLDEALVSQHLLCQIELPPISLALNDITHLKAGDVITTDYPLSTQWQLKHNTQAISLVEIGKNNQYKSIQLKSAL